VDRSEFIGAQAESLVTIPGGWAFVPPPLPPELTISRELLRKEGEARHAVGELLGIARRTDPALLIAPLRRREAVLSNEIEGTYTQVEDVLLGEATGTLESATPGTVEVVRTLEAIQLGQQWLKEGRPLTTGMLLELHARLLHSSRGEGKHPGEFRMRQVYLGMAGASLDAARFVPPPFEQVRPLVDQLVTFATGERAYGPLIDAALIHYQFEAIHPFEDGNGRLGRALISLLWLNWGLLPEPVLYLGGYFAAARERYIDALGQVSKAGNWEGWVDFFLSAVIAESRDAVRRIERTETLIATYRDAAAAASRSHVPVRAVDTVVERVFVCVADIVAACAVSIPAARDAIRALVRAGVLQQGPRLHGRQYWVAEEVLRILYDLR